MNRRSTLLTLCALSFPGAVPQAFAAAAGEAREGIDFVRVSPPRPPAKAGLEVIEFFSYGCPHCHELEPLVSKWQAALPKDVNFRRVPISFSNPRWVLLAKLYLTLESTGDLPKVHSEVFAAVHVQKVPLTDDKAVVDWAAKRVADPKKFTELYRSFGMQAMVNGAEQTGADFGVTGVPTFGVAGRYRVVGKEAKTYPELLRVTDKVIEMARHAPR